MILLRLGSRVRVLFSVLFFLEFLVRVVRILASANGGVIEGAVTDHKGVPMANAVVVAVPEARVRARMDRYGKTVSDQSGHFSLRGLRPGQYTLLAWGKIG